ncbi:MAG: radical SAM family heme chaperone HemW [Halofilum sp. (in: g-proteobacteria)]|nr:radical SAM family heme chaperone HemW [Halofilum sp. (in: g-proteobacteria)]
MEFHVNPPLTLYVHLPWCVKKCPYCDFNSHEARGELPIERYLEALASDLQQELPDVWGRPLEAVFIGGGTPSLFPPEAIERLLSAVRAYFNPDPEIEITLEANPGTLEAGRFEGFRAAGVNRLSLGIQSFDDERLRALGRIHDATEARAAIEATRAAGFDSFNLDLMYALPGQDIDAALADLDAALAWEPPHLSWYQLTLEPNTVFWSRPPALPDADAAADIESAGLECLAAAGLARYEVSAFARAPEWRCRHNLNYWRFGDYLGIGAGAHGKLTLAAAGAIERRAKVRAPQAWLERADGPERIASRRRLSAGDAAFEFLLNALRLVDGFEPGLFAERTGVPLAWLERPLASAEADGLLERDPQRIRPTPRGLDFHNDLLARFGTEIERWGAGREAAAGLRIVGEGMDG